jgi:hypothetical protein
MKFKDKISFITYLTSPEMYGKLTVSMSTESGCPPTFDFYFENRTKELPIKVRNVLHKILYDNFCYISIFDYMFKYISYSYFELVNNNGILEMVNSVYRSNHSFEESQIKSSLRKDLEGTLFKNYTLSIKLSGTYGKYGRKETVEVESFYLAKFDKNGEETEYNDVKDKYKNKVKDSLSSWAAEFSEISSRGEYILDSYEFDIHISYDDKYETDCYFIEESKRELIDLSIIEVEPEDAIEFEVEFN